MKQDSKPWEGLFDSNGDALDRLPDAVHAGASAIVFNDSGEVLLQKSSTYGKWAPPAWSARFGRKELDSEKGQALIETVMSVGFLVTIAIVMNKMLRPIVLEAFEKIANALSSVGP